MTKEEYAAWQNTNREYWLVEEKKKSVLILAMATRVLTREEHAEVLAFGRSLVIQNGVCYKESEKYTEWLELWYQQARLRALEDHKK